MSKKLITGLQQRFHVGPGRVPIIYISVFQQGYPRSLLFRKTCSGVLLDSIVHVSKIKPDVVGRFTSPSSLLIF